MKNLIAAFFLVLLANASVCASAAPELINGNINKASWNPITIKNNTPYDLAFRVVSRSFYGDAMYGIKKGSTDIYHSGRGDTTATLLVGVCSWMVKDGGLCTRVEPLTVANCFGGVHYNAEKIKSIQVNSLKSCVVTCLDGSKTSCVEDLSW
jgi:hypothetical protein